MIRPGLAEFMNACVALPVPFERGVEAANVIVQRLQVDQLDFADRARAGEFLAAHDVGELLGQLGHGGEVLRRLPRGVSAEAGQTLDNICRIADLAELAVADHRDPGLDLMPYSFVDRRLHHAVEFIRIVRLALVAREQQRHELGPAREAADMGGADHETSPLIAEGCYFIYAKLPQG